MAGTRVRRVTHDSFNDYKAMWRSDGRIAFRGQDRGRDFVAVLDSRGRTVKLPGLGGDVDWSPDGRRIVFDRLDRDLPQHQVWVANADGSGARMVVPDAGHDGAQPDWAPDGRRIVFVGGANRDFATIQVVNADGTGRVRLTNGGVESSPDWSPDGRRIVYAVGYASPGHHLAVIGADGSGARKLTSGLNDYLPAWSPDGRRIAFTSWRSGLDEIWVTSADGTGSARRITYGGCTRIGTTGRDVFTGGAGRDVLCGFEGDDALRGAAGDDRLVGGPGNDLLVGGAGDDVLAGEQGRDVLHAGAGADLLDGGSGLDSAFADARDLLYRIERAYGGRRARPIVLPTSAEVGAAARAAARASRARVYYLRVDVPRTFVLTVRVGDPAAYLRHRVNTALDRVFKAIRRVRFRSFEFSVRGPDGIAFSYRQTGSRSTWYVRPELMACAEGIDLGVEIDPDGVAPPCPAP